MICHTRAATQGSPSYRANNHPIATGGIVGVHNGMLWNDYDLFREMGDVPRLGTVDSEAIFAAIAYGKDTVDEIPVRATNSDGETETIYIPKRRIAPDLKGILEAIEGSAAVAWFDHDDPEAIHLARISQSPLVWGQTANGSFFFASTAWALQEMCQDLGLDLVYYEEAKEGEYFRVWRGVVTHYWNFDPSPGCTRYSSARALGSSRWWEDDYDEWAGANDSFLKEYGGSTTDSRTYVSSTTDTVQELTSGGGASMENLTDEDMEALDTIITDWGWLDSALIHPGARFQVSEDSIDYYDRYKDREREIEDWIQAHHTDGDKEFLHKAFDMHAFARPGKWVRTEFMGEVIAGQIVNLPQTFPEGAYTLLLYVGNKGRDRRHERVFAARYAYEFEPLVGPNLKEILEQIGDSRLIADAEEGLVA